MKNSMIRTSFILLAVAGAVLAASGTTRAQNYPAKPVRVVIPYAAGGFTDLSLRRIIAAMNLGQQLVVENRPGAGTLVGTQAVVEAAPDGYTLGFITSAATQNQATMKEWRIDPQKQLTPIAAVISLPVVLFVNPTKHNVRTIGEYIVNAKKAADAPIFASSGGSDVLPMELFRRMAGIRQEIVNFKGEANVKTAMLRGDADLASASLGAVRSETQAGTLRALAVTSLKRSTLYPDVPTVDEAGLRGYEFVVWSGFVAPAGTPRDIVGALNRAVVAAVRAPDVSKWITDGGNLVLGSTPEEFTQMFAADIAKWNRVAREAGVSPQ